jgi:hypothetical protein
MSDWPRALYFLFPICRLPRGEEDSLAMELGTALVGKSQFLGEGDESWVRDEVGGNMEV